MLCAFRTWLHALRSQLFALSFSAFQRPLDRFGAEHQAEGAGDADEGAFFLAAGLFGAEDHREVAVEAGPLFRTRKSLNVTRI